jgi:hypothetical protein
MSKAEIVAEIVLLLQGTPVADFARANFITDGDRPSVRCAASTTLASPEGELCKSGIVTAYRRYSYRFSKVQLAVFADLYVSALNHLEPEALVRVRARMCDVTSSDAQRDEDAARAVCERVSVDY